MQAATTMRYASIHLYIKDFHFQNQSHFPAFFFSLTLRFHTSRVAHLAYFYLYILCTEVFIWLVLTVQMH